MQNILINIIYNIVNTTTTLQLIVFTDSRVRNLPMRLLSLYNTYLWIRLFLDNSEIVIDNLSTSVPKYFFFFIDFDIIGVMLKIFA